MVTVQALLTFGWRKEERQPALIEKNKVLADFMMGCL